MRLLRQLAIGISFAFTLHAQMTGGNILNNGTLYNSSFSPAVQLGVSSVFSENFDTTTATSQWTINSDQTTTPGPALGWWQTGGNPGFRLSNYGHGAASAPWAAGSSNFVLSFNQMWVSGNIPQASGIQYNGSVPAINGVMLCASTDPTGAQSANTFSICYTATQAGPLLEVLQGIPHYLTATGTVTASTTLTAQTGALFLPAMVGQSFWLSTATATTGPFTITSVKSPTVVTFSPAATNNPNYTIRGDNNLTPQLGVAPPIPAYSIPWMIGQALSKNPMLHVVITRQGNTVTWNLYTSPMLPTGVAATGIQAALQFKQGLAPWGLTTISSLIGGNSANLSGAAATAAFQYINVTNLNADHTGWLGGGTSPAGVPVVPSSIAALIGTIGNIHAYGNILGGAVPAITSVLPAGPSGSANLIQPGTTIKISGTNLNSGSTIRLGNGPILQTVPTTLVSGSLLTAVLPAMSGGNGTYNFELVDPSGVQIPFTGGITYSAATITRMDPHEWNPTGGDPITVTGAGFDSSTTLTIGGGTCTNLVVLSSQTLTCNVPPGAVGIPTVILSSMAGTFTSSSVDKVLAKGYANHPYLQFTQSGLTALQSKWTNPLYADYTAPLKRDVSIAASITGMVGTFSVGDPVNQGSATGTCYGYHYGFMVIFPISGTFTAGGLSGPHGSATIGVIGSLPGMQTSFTAPTSNLLGTFRPGDLVTQGPNNSGLVYSFNGALLGIMPIAGTFSLAGNTTTVTGPAGSATLSPVHTLNSPNDGPSAAGGGWEINSWQNYAWFDTLANTTLYDNVLWNGTPLLGGADGLYQELDRLNWVDHWDQYFALESSAAQVAQFYDMAFPSLTQVERTAILNYLDRVRAVCTSLTGSFDPFIAPTSSSFNNWYTASNGSCLQANLAEINSVYTVGHGPTPDTVKHVNNMRGTSPTYSYGYINREVDADGVVLEGSQYTSFGLTPYLLAGRACLNAMGSDTCGAPGTGMLAMPHLAKQFTQYDLTADGTGSWQTFNDTQPQSYGAQLMAELCDRVNQPTLCYIGDTIAHRIAISDGFTGVLDWQASRYDYSPWALLWRSSTTASFGGFSTARFAPTQSYGVLRSSTSFQPSLVVGIKGQSSDMGINGHRESDAGSFVIQSQTEMKLIDPGYFQAAASGHSIFTVGGNSVQLGAAFTTVFDTSSLFDNGGGKQSIAMDVHSVFPTGIVNQARRTWATYGSKAVIILDDIAPVGTGSAATVVSSFQAGYPVTRSGAPLGMTNSIVGAKSTLACSFNGPSVTPGLTGPKSFGSSWVFANLGVQWYTFTASYSASLLNPLVMVCIDSVGGSGLSYQFSNSGSQITITFSDGTIYTFSFNGSKWALQ